MMWAALWITIGVAVAVAIGIARLSARYRRMFSEDHFKEVHDRFAVAIKTVQDASRTSTGDTRTEDKFITSAKLGIVVSEHRVDERQVLHVSLSQTTGLTTSAVAGRFGYFLVSILNRNQMELDPFVRPSGVRHLVFAWNGAPLAINDFGSVMEQYRTKYQPLPFRTMTADELRSTAN